MVTLMRPSHEIIVRLNRQAAAAVIALAACTPAFGQFTSAPGDSRYYTPPVAETPAEAAPTEPLLSYRRDDATTNQDSPTSAEPPTRIAAAPPLVGDANPLRKSPEPPSEAPPMGMGAAQPPSVVNGSAALQPPVESPATAESSISGTASNPFPSVAPLAPAVPPQLDESLTRYDAGVELAKHEEPTTSKGGPSVAPLLTPAPDADADARRLAPPTTSVESSSETTESKSKSLSFAFSKLESFSTAGAGLAIVIGLFLICVWMLRRGGAKASGVLPTDAFAVLGRAPLTSQSFAHLLRLGNKLVLVAMSPDGIQPLTEITDPMEVDRLTGLCASGRGHGPSAEFQQVLAQLSREPARGFLGSEGAEGRRR